MIFGLKITRESAKFRNKYINGARRGSVLNDLSPILSSRHEIYASVL